MRAHDSGSPGPREPVSVERQPPTFRVAGTRATMTRWDCASRSSAAECEPWAKTGGLADVVDALARALGHPEVDGVDGPVDVFLPRYRGVPEPDPSGCHRRDDARRAGSAGADGLVGRDASSTWRANGYRLRLVDHPPAFDREGFYGDAPGTTRTTPGGSGSSAGPRSRPSGRTTVRLTSCTSTTGTPAPPAIFRDLRYADDPCGGRGHDHDAPQPRLPRLDRERGACPSSGCGRMAAAPGQNADGIDLLAAGIEAAEIANTVVPGLRAGGADAGARDRPRRPAPAPRGSVHRDPQRARQRGLGSGHGPRIWRRPSRRRSRRQGRRAGRTC